MSCWVRDTLAPKGIPARIFFDASPFVANKGVALRPEIACRDMIADNKIDLISI